MLEQIEIRREWVGGQHALVEQVEPVWRIDGIGAYAHAGGRNQEAVDAIARAVQCRVGMAEVRFVPGVNAGLIRYLDLDAEIGQHRIGACLHVSFALFAEIVFIEIKQIVVFDVFFGCTTGLDVPDGLKQAAGHQPAVGQGQGFPAFENDTAVVIGQYVGTKLVLHRIF